MTKKMYQRQSKSKSLGQTLTGILIGLILGAIIIAVLLWFLNQQRLPTEPQRPAQNTDVEIIIPNQAVLPDSGSFTDKMASAVEEVEQKVNDWVEPIDTASAAVEQKDGSLLLPPKLPANQTSNEPKSSLNETKKPTVKADTKKDSDVVNHDQSKRSDAQESKKPATKPTAAEILEHGSVEKARQASKVEPKATATDQASADKPKNTGKRAKVQAGSYSQAEQAEAQRAKLALLGIKAHVETGQVNGKTVHRVRTASVNAQEAAQIRQKLQQQGIDAITVSGQ